MNSNRESFEIRLRTFTQPLDIPALFGNDRPVWVEIGFGVGKFLLEMSKMFPNINFIGLENDGMRHRNLLSKLVKQNISNVRVLYGNAVMSVKYLFPAESVNAVFINFSDPWPKERHEKNRLFSVDFVRSLAALLSAQGQVRVITDVLSYSEHIDVLLPGSGFFKKSESFNPHIDFPTTTFQDRFSEESIPFYPVVYKKVTRAQTKKL